MTAYQCTECGEPLERGRCPDRECREDIGLTLDTTEAQAALDDLVGRLDALDVMEIVIPPADPRSVLP